MKKAWLAIGVLGLALVGLAGVGLYSVSSEIMRAASSSRPYDQNADARRDIALATARAKAEGKLLLLEFGGNWCPYCRALGGIMQSPRVKAVVEKHYEVVWIDVGRFEKNVDLFERYAKWPEAVPANLIIDPGSDTLLNPDELIADSEGLAASAETMAKWLSAKAAAARPTASAATDAG